MRWSLIFFFVQVGSFEYTKSTDLKVLHVDGLSNETFTQIDYRNSGIYTSYEKVILNYGITTLGDSVFAQSTNLRYVIGESLFFQSKNLEYLVFPEGLRTIPFGTLRECRIKIVTFPSTATSIAGEASFSNNLQKIIVSEKNPIYSTSQDGTLLIINKTFLFQACGGCETIKIPSYITTIGEHFSCFRNVYNIIFEQNSNLTIVCYKAFAHSNILTIDFPIGLETIGDLCFDGCSVNRITLPHTLKSVPDNLFEGASRLNSVIASNSEALTIDTNGVIMNKNCSAIVFLPKTTTSFNIPWTLKLFDAVSMRTNVLFKAITADKNHSFYFAENNLLYEKNDNNLKFIGAAGSMTEIQIHKNCTSILKKVFEGTNVQKVSFLGEKVKYLNSYCFFGAKNLKEVNLTSSIAKILYQAFASASAFKLNRVQNLELIENEGFMNSGITKIDFSECVKLTSIGESCFYNCQNLNEVKLPPFITYLAKNLFNNCFRLEEITINSSQITKIDDYGFILCKVSKVYFTDISKSSALKYINTKAFYSTKLQSITIPDSVTSIGAEAFANNKFLTNITFGRDSQLGELPGRIISNSDSVSALFLGPKVSRIEEGALSESFGLIDIEVSEPNPFFVAADGIVTSRDGRELWACAGGRTKAVVDEGVSAIMSSAFLNCGKLKEVVFDEGGALSAIGASTFFGCAAIERLVLPANLRSIGESSFSGCRGLRDVGLEVPGGVEAVSDLAFGDCVALEEVYFCATRSAAGLSERAFSGCRQLRSIRVSVSFEGRSVFGLPASCVLDKALFTAAVEEVDTAVLLFAGLFGGTADSREVNCSLN